MLEGRDAGLRLTAWMVHHAAQVTCACMIGADGLTPFRIKGAQVRHAAGRFRCSRVAQRPCSGKIEQDQSEMHGGEVAWILPQVVPLHRGGL